jgi:hypothetical protein
MNKYASSYLKELKRWAANMKFQAPAFGIAAGLGAGIGATSGLINPEKNEQGEKQRLQSVLKGMAKGTAIGGGSALLLGTVLTNPTVDRALARSTNQRRWENSSIGEKVLHTISLLNIDDKEGTPMYPPLFNFKQKVNQ